MNRFEITVHASVAKTYMVEASEQSTAKVLAEMWMKDDLKRISPDDRHILHITVQHLQSIVPLDILTG